MKTKICTKCGKSRILSKFNKHKKTKDNLKCECKDCQRIYSQLYYINNKDKIKEQQRAWAKKNFKKVQKGKKITKLRMLYKISLNYYNKLLKNQNYVCAICGKKERRKIHNKITNLSVDHNHQTKKVRGLLCNRCNNGLIRFYDNVILLKKAIKYLKRRNK